MASVVATVKGEVTLPCEIDGDLGDATMSWKKIVDDTNTPEIRIYHSTYDPTPDGKKYAMSTLVKTYSLTIKNLEINDGGFYKCSLEGQTSDVKQTAVIVVGTYTITQYIGENIIGAFTVHVVNGYTCGNFSMFMYTRYLPSLLLCCSLHPIVWELGGGQPAFLHSSAPSVIFLLWRIWQDLSVYIIREELEVKVVWQ